MIHEVHLRKTRIMNDVFLYLDIIFRAFLADYFPFSIMPSKHTRHLDPEITQSNPTLRAIHAYVYCILTLCKEALTAVDREVISIEVEDSS
jgi:hypothetical protein